VGTNRLVYALVLGLGCFLIAGCSSDSPTAPTTDGIALQSINPAAGTMLTVGDQVTFTAVVTCTIATSEGGLTAMVVQDQANRSLLQAGEFAAQSVLRKGTETVTLSQTITIPEYVRGSTLTVALPIFINESGTTRAVVTRNYTVR
jgi:hypothetical protein